jgi:hypothetical protein
MRRNTNNWIARIFSVAAAAATPVVVGCNQDVSGGADMQPRADLRQPADQGSPTADLSEPEDLAATGGDGGSPDLAATPDLAGADFAWTDMAFMTVRRPFLVGASLRSAPPAARDDWADRAPPIDLAPDVRRALAAAWLKDALEEHASVAAFARFTIQALSVGAPPDLVEDAQRASLDEVRHARTCFALARRYGAADAGPGPLAVADALGETSLAGLAALTAEEGCVGETLGALLADEQARVAADPYVKRALERIARDERRHAELAWRFVAWACRTGGAPVVDAVSRAIASAVAATRAVVVRPLQTDVALWHAHGRLSCAESKAVAERGIASLVLPALATLRGERAAPAAASA